MDELPPNHRRDNVYPHSYFLEKQQSAKPKIITPAHVEWREFFDISYPTQEHARLLAAPYVGFIEIELADSNLNLTTVERRFYKRMDPRPARLVAHKAVLLACYKSFATDSRELHAARMVAAELKVVLGRHCVRVVATDVVVATEEVLDDLQPQRRSVQKNRRHLQLVKGGK